MIYHEVIKMLKIFNSSTCGRTALFQLLNDSCLVEVVGNSIMQMISKISDITEHLRGPGRWMQLQPASE